MNEFQNYLDSLTKKLKDLEKEGFNDQYTYHKEGLRSSKSMQTYKQEELKIVSKFRFEGESNPSDMSILYAIEASDGNKGTLIDAYGTYGDDGLEQFLTEVEDDSNKAL